MKFKKFAAIALATTMALSVFAACDNSSSKKSDKDTEKVEKDEEEEKETDKSEKDEPTESEETKESEAEVEETEATEESDETEATEESNETATTEETEESSEESGNMAYDFDINDEGECSAYSFKTYMDFIDKYEEENPGSLYNFYSYGGGSDFAWNLLIKINEDTYDLYGIVNGEVTKSDVVNWVTDNPVPYDVIKTLPIFMETFDYSYVTELEDGDYYGHIIAFTNDGSKATVMIGKPIIISPEQYNSLEEDQELIDINGNDTDFVVTKDEDGNLFYDMMWFVELEDGNYILETDSDIKVTYDHKCVILDIADDAKITDSFSYLYDNGEFTPSSDKTTSFTQTSFYFYATEDEYISSYTAYSYNDWTVYDGIVEPIVVEDGTITEMNLGWR